MPPDLFCMGCRGDIFRACLRQCCIWNSIGSDEKLLDSPGIRIFRCASRAWDLYISVHIAHMLAGSCTVVHLLSTGHSLFLYRHDLQVLFSSTDLQLEVSVTFVCGEWQLSLQQKYSTHPFLPSQLCEKLKHFRKRRNDLMWFFITDKWH